MDKCGMSLRIATLRQMAGLILTKLFRATTTPMGKATIPPTVAEHWVQNSIKRGDELKSKNKSTIICEPNVRVLLLCESGSIACMILSSSLESCRPPTTTPAVPFSATYSNEHQTVLRIYSGSTEGSSFCDLNVSAWESAGDT